MIAHTQSSGRIYCAHNKSNNGRKGRRKKKKKEKKKLLHKGKSGRLNGSHNRNWIGPLQQGGYQPTREREKKNGHCFL